MRVDEAGHHRGTAQADVAGGGAAGQLLVEADDASVPAPPRRFARARPHGIERDDVSVAQDQVQLHGIPSVSLSGGRW